MGLNDTPRGDRVHIALFGKRNAGKSSLINGLTGQKLAIVSETKGTTTDPVYKTMELLPLGPVVMIDTPGLDDDGELGQQRVEKAMEVLNKTDIAVIVLSAEEMNIHGDGRESISLEFEQEIITLVEKKKIPYIIVINKIDLLGDTSKAKENLILSNRISIGVSASTGEGIHQLKELLAKLLPESEEKHQLVGDLISPTDFVVLVVPIDSAAPKGRLILPQQQTVRDILDSHAIAIVTQESELKETIENLGKKPKLVITDSQAFGKVSQDTPKDIMLTSFSILFARHKGDLEELVKGAEAVESLKDGDIVLIAEGCTHHKQCDDIGTVKIPRWLLQHTGKKLLFETNNGREFSTDLSKYALIVHCGGCMLNKREMQYRITHAKEEQVPIVNYGVLIASMEGILKRSLEPFSMNN
jgi:[FeFe] hydrogenase H-cluster maturation GTPase HydF